VIWLCFCLALIAFATTGVVAVLRGRTDAAVRTRADEVGVGDVPAAPHRRLVTLRVLSALGAASVAVGIGFAGIEPRMWAAKPTTLGLVGDAWWEQALPGLALLLCAVFLAPFLSRTQGRWWLLGAPTALVGADVALSTLVGVGAEHDPVDGDGTVVLR
jgi:hypothetical protein